MSEVEYLSIINQQAKWQMEPSFFELDAGDFCVCLLYSCVWYLYMYEEYLNSL
jgi:hypothetical protein